MTRDLINRLIQLARREHTECEDPWYNCPATGTCTNDAYDFTQGCNCGTTDHNRLVDQIAEQILKDLPVEPVVDEQEPPLGGLPDDRFWKLPELKS